MMHEYIVMIVFVAASILFDRQGFRKLRQEIAGLRTELVRDYVRKQ